MAATGGFYSSKLAYVDTDGNPVNYFEGAYNSLETKPVAADNPGIASGSIIIEPDTGSVFIYDRSTDTWTEQFSLQS